MPPDAPLIILGIDAAEITLIERWAQEGHLPRFARLFQTAAHGRLATTSEVLCGSVWPSFATGCHPGKHGSYFRLQMRPGKNEIARIRGDHLFRLPFWAWLEGDAERVVVVDVPKIAPLPRANGLQVVEWGSYDHYWQFATSPAEAAEPLLARYGQHALLEDAPAPVQRSEYRRIRQGLLEGVRLKHQLHLGLLAERRPRVLVSVFGETHPAAHHFWHFHDTEHPDHDPDPELMLTIRDVYATVDWAVGDLIDTRPDATFLIFAGHGMQPDYDAPYFLPDLLYRMGLTVRPSAEASVAGSVQPQRRGLKAAIRRCLPRPLHRLLARRMPAAVKERRQLLAAIRDIDFARSRAFCVPADLQGFNQGFIRLNLAGREPTGVVPPGEYDRVCDDIERELLALVSAADGSPVTESVFRTHEVYANGDRLDNLPDLCVNFRPRGVATGVRSPTYGELEGPRTLLKRSGAHRPEGFYFALGPGIEPTARAGGHVLDIAPTLFTLLGKPLPDDWDGQPLPILSA